MEETRYFVKYDRANSATGGKIKKIFEVFRSREARDIVAHGLIRSGYCKHIIIGRAWPA